ncbi:MAG: dienelactone hydrolase family protein [Actinobacteria bacterium]|nr:dienelactone hydrolase family protein [Actinomycetota bacterium]
MTGKRSPRQTTTAPAVTMGIAFILALAACAPATTGPGSGGPASSDTSAPASTTTTAPSVLTGRPNELTREQRTFVDPSRKTPAGKTVGDVVGTPEQPSRTLVTEIYYPTTPGPRPLILFSHGSNGHPDKFTNLLSAWAMAGYVVAAPAFPLTNSKAPNGFANNFDVWDQPKDISFVLDQVLAASTTPGDALNGRVDPSRIGASGLSLGGATTYGLGFNPCCLDSRLKAFIVMAGALLPFPQDYAFDRSVPLLIMHCDNDPTLPYASSAVRAFGLAQPPKYLVTMTGCFHAFAFENEPRTQYDELVQKTTVDFWDAYLAGEQSQLALLDTDAVAVDGSTLQKG